ncbi:lysylphosphatidylglycerol synthase transmembrane domain-containing protein [Methanofollis fontis]|uniref:Lysylphosphatidylglycerol synthetase n=1 Tax=Methanofollis fontis TaxID=2052832 RepID=A0A483CVH0_9EURY|nr:flippase-like domain-containing protein [Methanofollis fontis]TAJ43406.1 lysylphosphatidylglycerol synthetase [Methanofollis fontis]
MKRSQWKWLFVSLGFSTVVLALVLYFTFDESTIDYLKQLNPWCLLLALLAHVVALGFWAGRMKSMSRSLGYSVGFFHCLNAVFANLLIAAITPSQAGGEPVRIHELYRAEVRLGDATAVVIMERILDGVVLVAISLVSMLLLGQQWQSMAPGLAAFIYLSWGLIAVLVFFFAYSVKNPQMLKDLLRRISVWLERRKRRRNAEKLNALLERIDNEVDNFHDSLGRFVNHGKAGLVWGTLFTAIFWTIEFLIPSVILVGLGEKPYFVESFIAQIIIALLMMIPLTPGGSGVAEVSATSIYGMFVNSSILGVFVLLWRMIFYYFNIFLGFAASIGILQREVKRDRRCRNH